MAGEEIVVEMEKGKTLGIKLQAVGKLDVKKASTHVTTMSPLCHLSGSPLRSPLHSHIWQVGKLDVKSGTREVFFDFNGMPRSVMITDRVAEANKVPRPKAAVAGDLSLP